MWVRELEVFEFCTGPNRLLTDPGMTSGIFTPLATYTAQRHTVRYFQSPSIIEYIVELIPDKGFLLFR